MIKHPNIVVPFPDQLRALSLPNCPVCTPAGAMLVTGRYPQTMGYFTLTPALIPL